VIDRSEHLVVRLRSAWKKGFSIGPSALHFLENALPQRDETALQQAIADPSDADSATVCEWIFLPDPAFQQRVEPVLGTEPFTAAEVERVVRLLQRRPPSVRLILRSWGVEVTCAMPQQVIEPLVAALRLSRKLSPHILGCLDRLPNPELRMAVRVRIRNRPLELRKGCAVFLGSFLQSVPPDEPEILSCVDLICELMEDGGTLEAMASVLTERKRHHFRSLKAAQRYRQKLRRHNIETLMMMGERTSHVDPVEAKRCMRRIDVISSACFGKVFHFEDAAPQLTAVSWKGSAGMDRRSG
jgi:hypothetical protein